jgi:hypothetical protein
MEKKQTNWDINFNKINTNNLPDPYGFNMNIVEVTNFNISHQKQDQSSEIQIL